jgi:hypothetical protein
MYYVKINLRTYPFSDEATARDFAKFWNVEFKS